MISLLLKMLLAHFMGDFLLQPDKWVKDKNERKLKSPYLYFHIGIHLLLLLIVFQFRIDYWPVYLIVPLSHFIIDSAKLLTDRPRISRISFFADQFLHLIIIAVIACSLYPNFVMPYHFFSDKMLSLYVCILLVTVTQAIMIKVLMSKWNINSIDDNSQSLQKAGMYIGMLERLFVFGFVLGGHWEGVGFLLAAKSIFRFGDLNQAKERKLTEYVMIGTLLSFGLAIITALAENKIILFTEQYK